MEYWNGGMMGVEIKTAAKLFPHSVLLKKSAPGA
jgi:hypothetical protein